MGRGRNTAINDYILNLKVRQCVVLHVPRRFRSFTRLDHARARELYEQGEALQAKVWHPYSVHLMRTRDSLLKVRTSYLSSTFLRARLFVFIDLLIY